MIGAGGVGSAVGLDAVAGIERVGIGRRPAVRKPLAEVRHLLHEERSLILAVEGRRALVALLAVFLARGDVLDIVAGEPGDHRAPYPAGCHRRRERLLDPRALLLG